MSCGSGPRTPTSACHSMFWMHGASSTRTCSHGSRTASDSERGLRNQRSSTRWSRRTHTRRRARAIAQTVAVLLLVVPAVALVAVLPGILATAGAATWIRWTLGVLRWPVISLMFILLLSLLYWAAPNTSRPFRLFTPGATATFLPCEAQRSRTSSTSFMTSQLP